MRSWIRSTVAVLATLGLVLAGVGAATADTVTASSAQFQVVAGQKTLTVPVGQTQTVTLSYASTNNDTVNGCNLSGNGSHDLTLDVKQAGVAPANAAGLDLSKQVVFHSCGDVITLNVKALQPGTTRVSLGYVSGPSGTSAADYDLSGATFVVTVPAVDSTPPTVAYQMSPSPNTAGWNNSDVTVHWLVNDPESSVTTNGCDDTTISADTSAAGVSLTCSASSAGGTTSKTATVKLDKTAPAVVPDVQGDLGNGGWYVGDVSIGWQVSDGGNSGLATQSSGCAGAMLTADTDSATYTCTVTDNAGNSTTGTVTVKRDATDPVITKTISGTLVNGWYTTDASVDWTVSDATSGVSPSTDCADHTLSEDSAGTTYTCQAVDNAGNTASDAVTIQRDATSPTITPTIDGTKGQNGWYTGDVSVTWALADDGSGVDNSTADGCGTRTVTADTTAAGVVLTCSVKDNAGNLATSSVTIKRDATKPALDHHITGTAGDNGWYTSSVGLSWTWSDGGSGIGYTTDCDPVTQDTETSGTDYTCSVTDLAGNTSTDPVTLKVDMTAPEVTPHYDGTPGKNGWWVSNTVGLTWTYDDALSGQVTVISGCGDQTVTDDTSGDTFSCKVKDQAGNVTDLPVTIKKDSTAPEVSAVRSGTAGNNGWFTSIVGLSWTFADATSGPNLDSKQGCDEVTITHETSGDHYTCSIEDQAGNIGSADTTVKIDTIAPVVTATVDGTLGDNGWYVGDVAVSWDVADGGSGMADGSTTGCDATSLTSDTAEADYTCVAADAAGNTTKVTETVKRDATKPVITKTLSGTVGNGGWYTSDAGVHWDISDNLSGLSAATDCQDQTLTADSNGTTYDCTAIDNAGNSATDSATFKRDATPPTITPHVVGTKGANGWYTSDVSVDWTLDDNLSGVDGATASGCDHQDVTTDTTGVTFTCTVQDVAGNSATESVTIKRDATAPSATATLSGTMHNGWYTGDVTVHWIPTDATSGVDQTATACPDAQQTTDTKGTTFSCTTYDLAGNAHTDSVTVKRDTTAPDITWTGGPADASSYDFGDAIPAATCTASDATSGVDANGCTVTGLGTAPGTYTLTATATDNAGNRAVVQRTYTVNPWSLDGFYKPVDMGTNVVNTVKAGSTVPLKFNVLKGGTKLSVNIGAVFTARKNGCDGTAALNSTDDFATTGGTALRWDSTGQQWIQNWATPTSGKGSCYLVTMTTQDGSSISAQFQLK